MSAELPRLSDSSAASFFLADLGFGVGASGASTAGAVRVPVMLLSGLIRAVCESERRRLFGDAVMLLQDSLDITRVIIADYPRVSFNRLPLVAFTHG